MGWSPENIDRKKKTDRIKTLKNEEKEKRRIWGKSNNNNIHLVLNYILLENIIWKEVVYTIKFYLQFLCVAGYLKHSNDTPNLNIRKYTNYNIIEIYINRLSTTTQIFIPMDYLIVMSEKYLYFRKEKNNWHMFSAPHGSNWIHVLWKYFSNYVFTKDMYKNLKQIVIIQHLSKSIIFVNLWVSKLHSSLH